MIACCGSINVNTVWFVIELSTDVMTAVYSKGQTNVPLATWIGCTNVVRLLVDDGCNVNDVMPLLCCDYGMLIVGIGCLQSGVNAFIVSSFD